MSKKSYRFKLVWSDDPQQPEVVENYEQECEDPEAWCLKIIDFFNSTLRPFERPRTLVRCEVEGAVPPYQHKWVKLTGEMSTTVRAGPWSGRIYDGMRCEKCGITGKRYGLNSNIVRDTPFKKKVFLRCDTALEARKTDGL